MKVSVTVDIADFMDYWGDDIFDKMLSDEIRADVFKQVKNSTEYKTLIKTQALKAIESL